MIEMMSLRIILYCIIPFIECTRIIRIYINISISKVCININISTRILCWQVRS